MPSRTQICCRVEGLPSHVTPASLGTINLQKLQAGSSEEEQALLTAAVTDGFFYLDLNHPEFQSLLDSVDDVFNLSEAVFNQDSTVKDLFDVDKISQLKTNGYKPKGRNIVNNMGGRDGFESWVLPRNGIFQLSNDPFPHTPVIATRLQSLRDLMTGLGSAAQTIFTSLSKALALQPGQQLELFHDPSQAAPDILRLLKYHATEATGLVPQTPHTDLGSLTFVFSTTPGLQVLPPGTASKNPAESDWVYVAPKAGHAVVNFGDCMTMLTNGLVKSSLHRVAPLPSVSMHERYSLAYLIRPQDSTVLRPLASPLIKPSLYSDDDVAVTSGQWITRKFKALRGKSEAKATEDHVLTGGRGVLV
ncbi:hypothetical protein SLS53_007680 [Cytospora paraplurivora]|uniref:Fe2OG dioxygenase domain-containing protein n=1 Tax=Cytospora paraplurivora TaxID=2898453 RepID=A0AAN9YDN1_9PEZI